MKPCLLRRIAEIEEVVGDARLSGRLPLVTNVAYPPNYGDFGDSWTLAMGTEIPLKMDIAEVLEMATFWANEAGHAKLVNQQRDSFDRLLIMENRPGPISDDRLHSLESELVSIKNASDSILRIAERDSRGLAAKKIAPMFAPGEALNMRRLNQELAKRSICKPLLIDGRPYVLKGKPYQLRQPVASA